MGFIQKYIFVILTVIGTVLLMFQTVFTDVAPYSAVIDLSDIKTLGQDYNSYYHAAKRLLASDNFYFASKQAVKFESEVANVFVYPPLMTFVFVPFSFMPFMLSFSSFLIFSTVLFVGALLLLSRQMPHRGKYLALFIPVYFLSPALVLHLERGQTDIVILFMIVSSFLFIKKGKSIAAGLMVGIAASLKLTPLIFLPYYFIRDKTAFWSALSTIAILIPIFSADVWMDFFAKMGAFSKGVTSGNLSNGLFGLIYSKYIFAYYSYGTAKIAYVLLILTIMALVFLFLYQRKKSDQFLLLEYAMLSSFIVIVPPTSWIYSSVHSVLLLTAYWSIRFNKTLSNRAYFIFDLLAYLIISQPVLTTLIRDYSIYHIFSLRPLAHLAFIAMFVYIMSKGGPRVLAGREAL